ncbi:uncharacterized protein [Triticum aestivum]|uniref:Uncharacterized protein n=1 Tax=Triticum turgidum subsp. durum TaxID=4567 RepID=A0A9R0XAE2_TRITD|nr:uncharacterized protein LOC123112160 isoform X1 [Triticum aestivum]XP_044389021.1 uncharacterized protein LOC123112160 isoform X1 [Triticum aestivum]XP_044389022.1 uncharacterized protein LOC123112160 isoform X1 [Triticum aestivum]XP_044389023.1 uncharacterized protein LOC123112160 isoform X1 [Triticum aestivum]XP_044389024.1 uncharacterized protein LOC123112160 isoform X1 [Triticum aestivum]XP_044389025.1 uncharacterized protein LOC123112160 isoform X1 [Triticum aestivum]VAI32988.1 unname
MSGLAASALPLAAGPNRSPRPLTPCPCSSPLPSQILTFRPRFPSFAGPSPLPRCRLTRPSGLTRPPLLKVAELQPCLLPRFASAKRLKCAAASGNGRQGLRASQYRFDDDEPLWLAVVREFAVSVRNLVVFLAEQPGQLKHLEWPGFRNTLRTAALTLILVVVFIVALSSVDAALSYILSWLLRKSA